MAKNATEYGFQFKGKQNGFLIIKNQWYFIKKLDM
jgi:hypothetical protein